MRKLTLTIIALGIVLAPTASAAPLVAVSAAAISAFSASARAAHWCRQGDPPIQASDRTSCVFAAVIINHYVWAGEPRYFRGHLRSPVTHKRYWITCRRTGPSQIWLDRVRCTGPNGTWTKFSADI
jgi:hypothetical protein